MVKGVRARHRVAIGVLVAAALLLGMQAASTAHEGEDDPLPADTGNDLRPVYEVPEGADRIIGSPDPGPKPQQAGDRGGSLQLVTMGAVAAAVGLVMWRITWAYRRAMRRAPTSPHD